MDRKNDIDRIFDKLEEVRTSLSHKIDEMNEKFHQRNTKHSIDIAELKVKSGIWGLLGGILSFIVLYLIETFKK